MRGAAEMRQRVRATFMGVVVLVLGILTFPTAASAFSGYATIRPATHTSGNTLSGQGVRIVGPPATSGGGVIALTIDSLEVGGAHPWAKTPAPLTFVHGTTSLRLSGIRFDFAKGTLEGSLSGRRLAVFHLGAKIEIEPATLSVSFSGGKLRLTDAAAKLLRTRFGLERALSHRGVGQVSMGATETTIICPPPQERGDPTKPPPPPSECVPVPPLEPASPPPISTP
jgi:hypothetical protein